jgi:hypothetical protein
MDELWPDPDVPYDYPARTPTNEQKWKQAVAAAVNAQSLQLVPRPGGEDLFDLSGSCPRCGHAMSTEIEFEVIRGLLALPPSSGIFNVSCNCRRPHAGRDDKHLGCGWGGSIPVPLEAG